MKRMPLTLKGAERLRTELKRLKSEERPRIIQAIAEARSHGDLSENAEYHAAREQQSFCEGRPHIVDMIKNDEISLIVNTTEGKQAIRESNSIRREAVHKRVTYYTTVAAGLATCDAIAHMNEVDVNRLQDLHQEALGA